SPVSPVLRNNLRPEIRHEILNIEINPVSDLREICRRREAFLADVKRCSGYMRSTPFKREISEFSQEYETQLESEPECEVDVEAFSLLCWNCRKEGHRYQDCYINSLPAGPKDPRPFLPIRVLDRTVYGLLDSGASISCLGGNLAREVVAQGVYKAINSNGKTADGRSQQIIGYFKAKEAAENLHSFWKNVRNCRIGVEYINSLPAGPKDPRPFLPIRVLDRTVYGLLDSGASISCLGGNLAREVVAQGVYKAINSNGKTADGRSQQIIGYFKAKEAAENLH
ncbi:hypothetical protein KR059_005688, partial [Drosophila kikkawai]